MISPGGTEVDGPTAVMGLPTAVHAFVFPRSVEIFAIYFLPATLAHVRDTSRAALSAALVICRLLEGSLAEVPARNSR